MNTKLTGDMPQYLPLQWLWYQVGTFCESNRITGWEKYPWPPEAGQDAGEHRLLCRVGRNRHSSSPSAPEGDAASRLGLPRVTWQPAARSLAPLCTCRGASRGRSEVCGCFGRDGLPLYSLELSASSLTKFHRVSVGMAGGGMEFPTGRFCCVLLSLFAGKFLWRVRYLMVRMDVCPLVGENILRSAT